jgi:hypothetical protein
MGITITEALAEIKTIGKRITAKRDFINGILWRPEAIRDPHDKDGGSYQLIARERQGITDLENRVVMLRRAIQTANETTTVSINGTSRSIADWLVWRRDVSPGTKSHLGALRQNLANMRDQARKQGVNIAATAETAQRNDVVVNINEADLAAEIEKLEDTLGQLDGQLSLKNATIVIAE